MHRGAFVWLLVVVSMGATDAIQYPWYDGLIEEVNSNSSLGWHAATNMRFHGYTKERAKILCGVIGSAAGVKTGHEVLLPRFHLVAEDDSDLPSDFDARNQWPGCIGDILDQGECGSCWAVAAAEAISDRLCIAMSKRKFLVRRSALDLVSCDFRGENMGCLGGIPSTAWQYAVRTGLATDKCLPYAEADGGPIPKCPANSTNPCTSSVATPTCPTYCPNATGADSVLVEDDRVRIHNAYTVGSYGNEKEIRTAIRKSGPVQASFYVYQDFLAYKSGVYRYASGENVGRHSIKIIGWGESPEPYWLVSNSWGKEWGDNGFFKIRRGKGECGIENSVVAGDAVAPLDVPVTPVVVV